MNRATVVACVVVTLTAGCATRGAVRQVAKDLHAVQTEVSLLRQAQSELARWVAEIAGIAQASRDKTAALQATVSATTAEVERLTTKVDKTDELVRRMQEALTVNAAAAPAPAALLAPNASREGRAGVAETVYAAGLANFRNREYGQAVLDFLDVVTKHPAHPLAPAAQYWIGEAYYLQRDYRQALVEFQRVVEWGSSSSRVAEALVKTGLCYGNLRETSRAQQAWRRVVRDFPDSPAAEQARSLLARNGSPPAADRP